MLRYSKYLLVLIVCLSYGCAENRFTQEMDIGVGVFKVPERFVFNQLQGIDSSVGEIIDPTDETFIIRMDIGGLAGNYVEENGLGFQTGMSVNEEFLYIQKGSQFLGDQDCCAFFTFPNAGPANFITNNNNFDLVLAIMETFESK